LINATYHFDAKLGVIYVMVPVYIPNSNYALVIFRRKVDGSSIYQKRKASIGYLVQEWKSMHEIQNKAFLFCNACFYYVSELGYLNKMSGRKIFAQHGIISIKLKESENERHYYDVVYNRLSVPLCTDCIEFDPIIYSLAITQKASLITE